MARSRTRLNRILPGVSQNTPGHSQLSRPMMALTAFCVFAPPRFRASLAAGVRRLAQNGPISAPASRYLDGMSINIALAHVAQQVTHQSLHQIENALGLEVELPFAEEPGRSNRKEVNFWPGIRRRERKP